MANEVQEIKDRLDLVEFIGQYVDLKQTGKNFRGLCPFHQENTPSFFVNPERQFYHCFGCEKSGDIYNFLMEREGLEFYEALKILAQRTGVELKTRPGQRKHREKHNRLVQAHDLVGRLYRHLLKNHPSGENARRYLADRGISSEMIKRFQLGYSPDSWDTTGKALIEKGFKEEELFSAGLLISKANTKNSKFEIRNSKFPRKGWYDRFRDRLMFPVHDHMGRIVGFSARALGGVKGSGEGKALTFKNARKGGNGMAKYINTPETSIYKKGKLLYGLYQAREDIRARNYIILVEGNLDVISLHQRGITNTVAPLGTGLTKDQISLIKRFTNRVLLCFDMDEAGEKATLRTIEAGLQTGLEIKIATLSNAKDPDEAAQKNFAQLKKDLTAARAVFEYLVELGKKKFALIETSGKRGFSEFVLPFVAQVEDAIEKDDYLHRVAEILAVSEDSVRSELAKAESKIINQEFKVKEGKLPTTHHKPQTRSRAELISEHLIAMLLQTPPALFRDAQLIDLAEEIEEKFLPEEKQADFWPILQSFLTQLKTTTKLDHNLLNKQLGDEQTQLVNLLALKELGTIVEGEDTFLQTFEETTHELKSLWLKQEMNKVTQKIREAERDGNEEKVQKLKATFKKLSSELC